MPRDGSRLDLVRSRLRTMADGVSVRCAGKDDVPAIVRLGGEMFKRAPALLPLGWDEKGAADMATRYVSTAESITLIAERDGEAVGFFFISVIDSYTEKRMAVPAVFCVGPGREGVVVAIRLMHAALSAMKALGCARMYFSAILGAQSDETINRMLIRRFGFKPCAVSLCKDL